MNPTQKRSHGCYGLRRKVTKKRWDDDFEYYFSKIGSLDKSDAEQETFEEQTQVVLLTDVSKHSNNSRTKNGKMFEKRCRGRPKKVQGTNERHATNQQQSQPSDKEMLNFQTSNKPPTYVQVNEGHDHNSKNISCCSCKCEQNGKEQLIVSLNSVHGDVCADKSLKLDDILSPEEITCLQEEEVTSAPEIEKENLPGDGAHIESEHETMVVQMTRESAELEDIEEIEKRLRSPKMKRRFKRNHLSEETIEKLSQLNPSGKIECSECHKLLKPSSYRQHLRTHSGVKPFSCDLCDARFTRKGDVERHVRIVHNKQKPFKCSKCHRSYGDKKNLRWHLMNHDKRLFYVCEVCGFKFGKREYWENHVRLIHPIGNGLKVQKYDCKSEREENERIYAFSDRFLAENDGSIDDPADDSLQVEAAQSYTHDQQLFYPTDRGTVVAEICVGSERKSVKLDNASSNLVNVNNKTKCNFVLSDDLRDHDSAGAVIIQLDGNEKNEDQLHEKYSKSAQKVLQNDIFEVSPDVLHFEQEFGEEGQSEFELSDRVYEDSRDFVEVSVGQEGVRSVEYVRKINSKVYNISLTEEQAKRSSVHSLLKALLTVVRTDNQSRKALQAS